VLHVAPESEDGGPLALVRTGDHITLDVPARSLSMDVDEEELARRRASWTPTATEHLRGWYRLYVQEVNQADEGADLRFLVGKSTDRIERESH
jgi:dihydroxy-acid dehydratase